MKILIIEDHSLFCEGLTLLLKKLNPLVETITANNLRDGLCLTERHQDIDLVLLDLALPGYIGTEALYLFKQKNSALPVIILSGTYDQQTVIKTLELGAMSFIPKTASSDILMNALQIVLASGVYLPPCIFSSSAVTTNTIDTKKNLDEYLSALNLTRRQIQVFRLIIQGKPNKEIATDLQLTESTIKAHVKPILKALNVTSRVQAILEVSRLNLLIHSKNV
jgi:DNA-binding NarL/FixJ family response regulator